MEGAKIKQVDGLWPIERVAIPDLAMILWEQLHPGKHPASATDEDRALYIKATQRVLDVLAEAGNVRFYP